MLYGSLVLNLALFVLAGKLWLLARDQKGDSERSARELELMLQSQQAEHRTELLQAHAMLMEARYQVRELQSSLKCADETSDEHVESLSASVA